MKWNNELTNNWNECSNLLFKFGISGSAFVLLQNGSTVHSWVMPNELWMIFLDSSDENKTTSINTVTKIMFYSCEKGSTIWNQTSSWSSFVIDNGQMPLQPSSFDRHSNVDNLKISSRWSRAQFLFHSKI